jgi:hypothetical protein
VHPVADLVYHAVTADDASVVAEIAGIRAIADAISAHRPDAPIEVVTLAAFRPRPSGVRRLFVVGPGEPAPWPIEVLEDWVRIPVPVPDLRARLEVIRDRQAHVPSVDEWGCLRYRGRSTYVSPSVEVVIDLLARNWGRVVPYADLAATTGVERAVAGSAARARVAARRVGLDVVNVRGAGYALRAQPAVAEDGPDRAIRAKNAPARVKTSSGRHRPGSPTVIPADGPQQRATRYQPANRRETEKAHG